MRTITTIFAARPVRRSFRALITLLAALNECRIARLERRLARLMKNRTTASEIFGMLDEMDTLCEGTR